MKLQRMAITLLLLGAAVIFLSGGCADRSRTESFNGNTEQTLKVGILPNEEILPVYVAEQEGIFEKLGLQVEIINFQSAAERDAALQAGAVDGVEGDLLAVALIRQGGTPVKAVSLVMGATPAEGRFALLAAPGSAIEVKDLKGKQIAISQNTIIEYVADQMLQTNGIDPKDVKKVNVAKMPLRMEMLLQNRVAAAVLPDPLASYAELKGSRVLIDDTKMEDNISQSVFFFRDEVIETKREAINKFLRAYAEGARKVTENPERYRDLFNEKVQIPVELQKSYPVPTFSPLQLPSREDTQRVIDWLKAKELLKEPFSYEDLVTDEAIKAE